MLRKMVTKVPPALEGFATWKATDMWAIAGLGENAKGEVGSGCHGREVYTQGQAQTERQAKVFKWKMFLIEGIQLPEEAYTSQDLLKVVRSWGLGLGREVDANHEWLRMFCQGG